MTPGHKKMPRGRKTVTPGHEKVAPGHKKVTPRAQKGAPGAQKGAPGGRFDSQWYHTTLCINMHTSIRTYVHGMYVTIIMHSMY